MNFTGAHILSIQQFEPDDIEAIFAVADAMLPFARRQKATRVLDGAIMGNMFFGLKEHISSLGGFNLFQIGLSAGMKIESLNVGFSYTNPMGLSKIASPSAFEIFLSFDLSSFRERNRKDFSRFY